MVTFSFQRSSHRDQIRFFWESLQLPIYGCNCNIVVRFDFVFVVRSTASFFGEFVQAPGVLREQSGPGQKSAGPGANF